MYYVSHETHGGTATRGPGAPLSSRPQGSHLLACAYMLATEKLNGLFEIGFLGTNPGRRPGCEYSLWHNFKQRQGKHNCRDI